MNPINRDAKITIDFGEEKIEFVADVRIYDFQEKEPKPITRYQDNTWNWISLPKPPLCKIEGHSFGQIDLIIKS